MKCILSIFLILLFLPACGNHEDCLQQGIQLRQQLLENGCSFVADITADYGDKTYTFSVGCTADRSGDIRFIIIAPETIAGISGQLSNEKGFLTFDETVLAFPLLADGEVSPVSAPWLLLNTLRSGYLSSAGKDGTETVLTIYDSYEKESLQLDIWLDETGYPKFADVLWQGRSILSIAVKEFSIV